jgi:hypothetical protein
VNLPAPPVPLAQSWHLPSLPNVILCTLLWAATLRKLTHVPPDLLHASLLLFERRNVNFSACTHSGPPPSARASRTPPVCLASHLIVAAQNHGIAHEPAQALGVRRLARLPRGHVGGAELLLRPEDAGLQQVSRRLFGNFLSDGEPDGAIRRAHMSLRFLYKFSSITDPTRRRRDALPTLAARAEGTAAGTAPGFAA